MKYTAEDYLNEPWFEGDEGEIACQTIKFVKVRKEHQCWLSLGKSTPEHNVKKGAYAYYEKALVDGEFVSYYMCTDCMDAWLDECYGEEVEQDADNNDEDERGVVRLGPAMDVVRLLSQKYSGQ